MVYFETMPINHFDMLDSFRRSLFVNLNEYAHKTKDSDV